jgi:DNA-binding CsgD family transcriptional regulator
MNPRGPNYQIERRIRQEQRILAVIANEALTAQQIADRLYITRDGVNIHLKRLKDESPRRLYIEGHEKTGARPAAVYRAGSNPDAEYEITRAPKTMRKQTIARNRQAIIDLLTKTPMTTYELSILIGLSQVWTRHYTDELRAEKKLYVRRWQRNPGTHPSPVLAVGPQKDAELKKRTVKEQYREKMRDPDRALAYRERGAIRRIVRATRKAPQGIFAALGL